MSVAPGQRYQSNITRRIVLVLDNRPPTASRHRSPSWVCQYQDNGRHTALQEHHIARKWTLLKSSVEDTLCELLNVPTAEIVATVQALHAEVSKLREQAARDAAERREAEHHAAERHRRQEQMRRLLAEVIANPPVDLVDAVRSLVPRKPKA